MKIQIEIQTDNAAFADAGVELEAARILHSMAQNLRSGRWTAEVGVENTARDGNGNTVAVMTVTE